MPSATLPALQKDLRAEPAWRPSLNCSKNFVNMMYQVPSDMMTRMISVPRATKSPPFHSASRPYGLSTTSLPLSTTGGGATGVAAGASLPASADCACAACVYAPTATAVPAPIITVASTAIQRLRKNIPPPSNMRGNYPDEKT